MTSPSLQAHPRVEQWITFDADGTTVVHSGKVEIGQRISTALVAIAAAELAQAPERVRLAPVATGASPDEGMTSGSNSLEHSGEAVRLAAATARRALLSLAAQALGVDPGALQLADGLVRERDGNRSVSVRELLPDGRLAIPVQTDTTDPPATLDAAAIARLRAPARPARAGAAACPGREAAPREGTPRGP
jgi:CO/xanthine dehydrogenase Mo-binding subunit